jgi:four helix bundle protein
MSGSFKDLKVWQRSRALAVDLYNITKDFPREETYNLVTQIRKCAVSIPSNIAEGHRRGTNKEFVQFLNISRGSLAELETQVIISTDLGYVQKERSEKVLAEVEEIGKMINGLINSIS